MVNDEYIINIATIAVDFAAIFFLGGIIFYTMSYKRRGELKDNIFFAALITDIVAAASDAICDAGEFFVSPFSYVVMVVFGTVFLIAIGILCYLITLYLLCYTEGGREKVIKNRLLYSIPAVILLVMSLANIPGKFLFYIDNVLNEYHYGTFYELIFIPMLFYIVYASFILWKINKAGLAIFYFLVIGRLVMDVLIPGVSSTAFFFVIVLTYLHIGEMNYSYNTEVRS